jgi:hypothetical protein
MEEVKEEKPLTKSELAILMGNKLKSKTIDSKDFTKLSQQLMVLLFPEVIQEAKRKMRGRPRGAKNKKQKPKADINTLVREIEAAKKEANGTDSTNPR